MPRVRPEELVRHFHENGIKLLFHEPANVRDLLRLRDPQRADRLDFARMTIDPTSCVAADYRHLASDLVLKVPYRSRAGGRRRTLTVYLLIEHQSQPDALMALRVLDYLVQIYKAQARSWERRPPHGEACGCNQSCPSSSIRGNAAGTPWRRWRSWSKGVRSSPTCCRPSSLCF